MTEITAKEFYLVTNKTTNDFIGLFTNKKYVYDLLKTLSDKLSFNSVFAYGTKSVNYSNLNKLLKSILFFESIEVIFENNEIVQRIEIKKISTNQAFIK